MRSAWAQLDLVKDEEFSDIRKCSIAFHSFTDRGASRIPELIQARV